MRLGVEYDGRHHLDPEQTLRRSSGRRCSTDGWTVLRFPARTVLADPDHIDARTRPSTPCGG